PSGKLPALGALVRSALLGRLPLMEIAAEIARQVDAFAQHFDRLPDHVDGHQHVHALPGIRDALLQMLVERDLASRLWLCHPGYSDEALARLDPATRSREAELAFLLSPAFSEVLADHSAELTRLSEALRGH